ncbi:prepilin peptidase [Microbacterium protaetiae]|uniref:Prepilin leader peptidase/N-methyltransferase n=1 Tax=Microbacterium protaetiae TaxID=2509458 RepID=A0A4P6EGM6_9MICO|nr:A24 family peptidase [Microbacterium protaetiae]QAY61620.1 prepilin peptidase [Microbacterium protaetiae]
MTTPVLIFVLACAGLIGLVVGSFLGVVIFRVPAAIALRRESRCPQCDARVRPQHTVPVVSWLALRGACADCGNPIPVRYPLVEGATALAFAGVTWGVLRAGAAEAPIAAGGWLAASLVLVALLYLVAISITLLFIDLDVHRLPDSIVLPAYPVGFVLLGTASALAADGAAIVRMAIGMVALYLFYALLRFIGTGGMGGGDVKLAGVLGMFLGWLGWSTLLLGALAAFLLGGVFAIALMVSRRATRHTRIPFGPWMLAGAWLGIVVGPALGAG